MKLQFTSAIIVAAIGSAIALAVSFGVDLRPNQIDAVMTLVGLLGGAIVIGGAQKTAGLIKAGVAQTGISFHFTPAVFVALAAAGIAVAVSFGLSISTTSIAAIMKLVGLLAGSIVVGGGIKSQALLMAGIHPKIKTHPVTTHAAPHAQHPAQHPGAGTGKR